MEQDQILTEELREFLLEGGADLVGFGDLTALPGDVRGELPVGVGIAVKFPKEIIRGISELPTPEYREWYGILNERLDMLATTGAKFLEKRGYRAIAKTRQQVGGYADDVCRTLLPYKTIATRAGLGWIGKCALLVTKEYGSMVRLSALLTDAPLVTAEPVNESLCGNCTVCQKACPAGAISGTLWNVSTERGELFDFMKCSETARKRSEQGYGKPETICGKCIEVCPYTRRYLHLEKV